ncbi:Co-chaperone Hsc20 [Conidiobolus coronatus NRRL 28638]|uniref:Co-chaperone Hsc20 n=1 Tax=Conidiobolus coronatus (strain ATCC 28846 / CBS 209.66 / NRRL 28638) TaxID=796925 RepID=A0A137PF70_CONC2|nr:Co-chaperone Hsc20 [Conidiobolus coronatus NRRL 28638]|eukprot:KXN73637.1 Co-chaperone Hsc20 [Conidiobolus coronatus NRRL 28638]
MLLQYRLFNSNLPSKLLKRTFFTFTQYDKHCWKCNNTLPDSKIQCTVTDCKSFQHIPDNVDYFQLFDKSKNFDINETQLKKEFLQLQRKVHPDNFTRVEQKEQVVSANLSSLLNKAYQTLKDPLLRAKYMLTIEGTPISETDKLEDNSLLFEIMELHEEIQDSEDKGQISSILDTTRDQISSITSELQKNFEENDLKAAKINTIKLKYLVNVYTTADNKLHSI